MENFVVSARKYRPAIFDSVVGQSAITGTLKNAMRSNHLAQAFLFCGPRGVGKTTCARILAKTINCQNLTENIEACNECDSCKSFNTGHSLNIFELDAASNNSVDDIRSLISQVSFAPQLGKYKVYIIDEVHMLSQAAFNAFLKTLEEPPKHAVFILATTEKHKIIPTILSRCQIFDFHRIQVKDISSHLDYIAKNEGINAEPDALHIIAQKADGALRDALSIFDQLVSFAGKTLTYQSVITNLNVLDYDYYFTITEDILQHKIPKTLLVFNEILNKGFDGHNFIMGLAEHFRNLLVCKDSSTIQLLEVSDNIKAKYLEQCGKCAEAFLLKGLEISNKCDVQYKMSKNPRLLVELCLMQLCSVDTTDFSAEKKNSEIKILPPENRQNGNLLQEINPNRPLTISIVEEKLEHYRPSPKESGFPNTSKTPPALPIAVEPQPVQNSNPFEKNPSETRTRLKTKSISINDALQSNSQLSNENGKNENLLKETKPGDLFSETRLIEIWNNFASLLKKQGKESLFSILTKRPPRIINENKVEFLIENTVMETAFLLVKPEMMEYLCRELNNFHLELYVIVNKNMEQKKAYTNREKFVKLAEKNPLLMKMKQQLDLEVD